MVILLVFFCADGVGAHEACTPDPTEVPTYPRYNLGPHVGLVEAWGRALRERQKAWWWWAARSKVIYVEGEKNHIMVSQKI